MADVTLTTDHTTPGGSRVEWLLTGLGVLALAAAPFFFYPVFVMSMLCFALFACAFNLLLGYTGLLSFGHAAFFGGAAYFTAHAVKIWGVTPEVGLVIGTALGWGTIATIALAVGLAFLFGYAFTTVPLLRAGLPVRTALGLALAADTVSITIMEVVDNGVMLLIPGAMDAGLASPLFWGSLVVALAIAAVAAFPVNRWLIARGRGHAVVHQHHGHHH